MLDFFLQTTHFVKSRAHSPRPTSKIIGMIALRDAILMKADLLVRLHAHGLFSGRACSCFLKQSLWDFLFYVIYVILAIVVDSRALPLVGSELSCIPGKRWGGGGMGERESSLSLSRSSLRSFFFLREFFSTI